jgi:hypothetical protein
MDPHIVSRARREPSGGLAELLESFHGGAIPMAFWTLIRLRTSKLCLNPAKTSVNCQTRWWCRFSIPGHSENPSSAVARPPWHMAKFCLPSQVAQDRLGSCIETPELGIASEKCRSGFRPVLRFSEYQTLFQSKAVRGIYLNLKRPLQVPVTCAAVTGVLPAP